MKRTGAVLAVLMATLSIGLPATAQETAPVEGAAPQPAADSTGATATEAKENPCQPGFGCVTNLPLPRFVSLKGSEGNARRGPGLTHRIDWVFTRSGMPLRITAEFENWRRVEDAEGAGGWVHYSLLSGSRTALVTLDMVEFRDTPSDDGTVVAQAETGVIGRIIECQPDWCRIALEGQRGWVRKSAIWGVNADEVFD